MEQDGAGWFSLVLEAPGAHPDLPWLSPLVSHWAELHWQGPCLWGGLSGMTGFGMDKGRAGLRWALLLFAALELLEWAPLAGGAALRLFV